MNIGTKKGIALTLVLVAGATFAYTYLHAAVFSANPDEVDSGIAPTTSAPALSSGAAGGSERAGTPARIRIPKIGVDAKVTDVGLGKTGNMAVPLTFTDVGWYRYGPKPGEVGSAVIDGHVDNGLGVPAVFASMGELEAGDDIYIDTAAGDTLHFIVGENDVYAVADVPRGQVFNRSDAPRLNLITCDGAWIQDQKMYDERRVVYAMLSPE